MSTVRHGDVSALVIIDLQNNVVAEAHDREGVISRTVALIDRARDAGAPLIFVQHEDEEMQAGSDGWQLVPELVPADGEPVIAKRYQDSFEETTLEETLARLGVSRLVIAGAQSDACIRFTTQRALAEGYDLTLVSDCHTTDDRIFGDLAVRAEDIIGHTNLVYQFARYPNRTADVATHDSVSFATAAAQENRDHVAS